MQKMKKVLAILLTLIRKTHKAYIRTRDFNFSLSGLTGFDLHGKTVGVVGTGKIGRVFIDICRGFGMRVIAFDPFPVEGIDYVELDTLLAESDYPVIIDTAYSKTASYGITVTGLYGGETEMMEVSKFTTSDGGVGSDLPSYYRNFLTDYTKILTISKRKLFSI